MKGQQLVRRGAWALLVGLLTSVAHGAEQPDWAFSIADQVQPPSQNTDQPKTKCDFSAAVSAQAKRTSGHIQIP
jgi:hypothetical protein